MKITFEFATKDNCLDKMVPSDLRSLVVERDNMFEALKFIANQHNKSGNWAVELAKRVLKETNL